MCKRTPAHKKVWKSKHTHSETHNEVFPSVSCQTTMRGLKELCRALMPPVTNESPKGEDHWSPGRVWDLLPWQTSWLTFLAPLGVGHRQIETHSCHQYGAWSCNKCACQWGKRHVRPSMICGSNDPGTQANTCSTIPYMHASHTTANSVTTVTTTAAIFMSRICAELHYHGPDPAFGLAFVGFPACLCLSQMSCLCRLCILSINVNNLTCNIMKACGPFAHRYINTFLCVWLCALFLPSPLHLDHCGFH